MDRLRPFHAKRLALFLFLSSLAVAFLIPPTGQAQTGEPFLQPAAVVVAVNRPVCSLLGGLKTSAGIIGMDGSHTVEVNGTVYWNFGDTLLSNGGLLPNSIGWSTDTDASDCIELTPKQRNGRAAPLLVQPNGGKLTVWPLGMEQTAPGHVSFYYASVVPDPVGQWRVAGTGIASFNTTTLDATPALGGALVWPEGGFMPSRTIPDDHYVYVLLDKWGTHFTAETILARVPKQSMTSPGAYEYWDAAAGRWLGGLWNDATGTWQPSINSLAPLWRQPGLHNGVEIAYNEFLGKWLAVYTTGFMTSLNARVADSLTGPWDVQDTVLIRCPDFHPPQSVPSSPGFACYTGAQHEFYARDGGRTIYVTYANSDAYQVFMHEIRLAASFTQWRDAGGRALYLRADAAGPTGFAADGVAFYASDIAAPGLTAIHAWEESPGGNVAYGAAAPAPATQYRDMGVAFYAPLTEAAAQATNATHTAVYRWTNGATTRYSPLDLGAAGYARQEIVFYAPCPDADGDALTDCAESFLGTSALAADTDGDGLGDGYEQTVPECDPLVYNDDADGIAGGQEALSGTNPCVWDTGAYGCAYAEFHHPLCDVDTDGDGCNDATELGPDARLGGRRSPNNPWDFYDLNGDRAINVRDDVVGVVTAFGLGTSPNYTRKKDRSPPPPPSVEPDPSLREPWDLGPPDGAISVGGDLLGVMRQFGHSCRPLS